MKRKNKLLLLLSLVGAMALLVVGCGSSSSDDTASAGSGDAAADTTETAAGTETLKLGIVPSVDLGVIKLGEQQGYFEDEGISLDIKAVDSGPTILTGLVADQFDIGWVAYAPPVLAIGEGDAPLRVISNSSNQGPEGTNGGVLVKKDSGISSWKDLAGKKIGTNAPRSLFSLVLPAAIKKDGGDPSGIELVPLPFTSMGKAVADGDIDAGMFLEPFQSAATKDYPDLVNLGDPSFYTLPEGSPQSAYVTTESIESNKSDLIAGFKSAYLKSVEYASDHEDEAKAAGGELAGLPPAAAKALPLAPFTTPEVTAAELEPLTEMMVEFDWLKEQPDLTAFVGQ